MIKWQILMLFCLSLTSKNICSMNFYQDELMGSPPKSVQTTCTAEQERKSDLSTTSEATTTERSSLILVEEEEIKAKNDLSFTAAAPPRTTKKEKVRGGKPRHDRSPLEETPVIVPVIVEQPQPKSVYQVIEVKDEATRAREHDETFRYVGGQRVVIHKKLPDTNK